LRDNAINGVFVRLFYRLDNPSKVSEVPDASAKAQADAVVDGVEVVDLTVALEDFNEVWISAAAGIGRGTMGSIWTYGKRDAAARPGQIRSFRRSSESRTRARLRVLDG
jgi:hypothetical protein